MCVTVVYVRLCVCVRACVCVCARVRACTRFRARTRVQLEADGTYECERTGVIFEASRPVVVRYSVLPWPTFRRFLQEPWAIAGPTFNVETVPKDDSALRSIQLPHCLCLAGEDIDHPLLYADSGGKLRGPVRVSQGAAFVWGTGGTRNRTGTSQYLV